MLRFLLRPSICRFAASVLLATGCVSGLFSQVPANAPGPVTAGEAIDRIVKATGATLPTNTVDTIKAGDPATIVTGIATTFTPSMEVLRQAVAAGDNLIVTHEPTFYNHLDQTTLFTGDPVYQEKIAYIEAHHLIIWRFHDTWHMRDPDGIDEGFVDKAGWKAYRNAGPQTGVPWLFTLPQTTVLGLAQDLQRKLGARAIRIVGDPGMAVTHVAFAPGAGGEAKQVKALERDDVEVLVAGEASEWETVEYARDAELQGRHKALILLGHLTSEEPGMARCAEWLRPLFPGVRVDFIPAKEPYWTPQQQPKASD